MSFSRFLLHFPILEVLSYMYRLTRIITSYMSAYAATIKDKLNKSSLALHNINIWRRIFSTRVNENVKSRDKSLI